MERLHEIPLAVRNFIAEHVPSQTALEILLLLLRSPSQTEMGTAAIGRTLQINREAVEYAIEQFQSGGITESRKSGLETFYRINSSASDTIATLDELARWYATHPLRIWNLILATRSDRIQTFSDERKKD